MSAASGDRGPGIPSNVRALSVALAAIGLLLGTLLVGYFGFGRVAESLASVGWAGFAAICLWQMLIFFVLGLAWFVITPGHRPLPVFIWGRMVRDGAANCLPFSQIGGFVLGARALVLHGVAWPVAAASTVVDVTAEFLSQIVFAAIGLLILLSYNPHSSIEIPTALGLVAASGCGILFIVLQRRGASWFGRLGQRIGGRLLGGDAQGIAALQTELTLISGRTRLVALGMAIHLTGWIASGLAGWIALRLLGVPISVPGALAIEGLLQVVLAASFLVPGNIGVQEAAYIGLGSVFGVTPEIALGLSLLRRARDLTVGIPALVIWQLVEVHRARTVRAG